MAIIQSGATTDTLTIEATRKAARTVDYPLESLTWISFGATTGLITGLAASSSGTPVAIFSLRNSGSNIMLIRRVGVGFIATTAFTTAQRVEFALAVARGFSASDSGGTAITLTGNNARMRTSLPALTSVDARIATTAALTNGTKTLDATLLAIQAGHVAGVGNAINPAIDNLLKHDPGDLPLVLAASEGINIVNNFAMGAAGVGVAYVNVEVAEVTAYA